MKRARPFSRFRRFVKRLAIIATISLAVVWLGSQRWRLSFLSAGANYELAVSSACLRFDWIPFSYQGVQKFTFSPGFNFSRHYFTRGRWLPGIAIGGCPGNVVVPLWLATAAALLAWLILSWPDLRARWLAWRLGPDHCLRCGYDLTGNVSGRCPECGKTIKPGQAAPGNGAGEPVAAAGNGESQMNADGGRDGDIKAFDIDPFPKCLFS